MEQDSRKGVIAQEEILNAIRPRDSSPIIAPINSWKLENVLKLL